MAVGIQNKMIAKVTVHSKLATCIRVTEFSSSVNHQN
jgi:hypothetical protein